MASHHYAGGGAGGSGTGVGGDTHVDMYKIILIGDATVGKTHLVSRYVRGTLPKNPQATIGVEFATRTVPLRTGGTVKAQIWDTAGQERYRSITAAHYRKAVGALLVYDITRRDTFANIPNWLEELRHSAQPDVAIMLVGNKVDLVEHDPSTRDVDKLIAAEYAEKNGLFFVETSAVQNTNVKNMFEILVQEVYNTRQKKSYSDVRSSGTGGSTRGGLVASNRMFTEDGAGGVDIHNDNRGSGGKRGGFSQSACCAEL